TTHRRCVHRDLVGAGAQDRRREVRGADPAADAERDAERSGDAPSEGDDGPPSLRRGGDVEEDDLVGPLTVVARCQCDGIAGVTQVHESRALDHAPVAHVEARNDPLGEHRHPAVARTKERSADVPIAPPVPGWNRRPSKPSPPTAAVTRPPWSTEATIARASTGSTAYEC